MAGPRRKETTIRDLLPPEVIVKRLWVADKEEALAELLNTLVIEAGVADLGRETEFKEALFEREKVASTGIGNGLALPHVKSKFADKWAVAVGQSEDGIEWGAHDGQPVRLVVMWVCPPTETKSHLALMRALAAMAKETGNIDKLVAARDRKRFLEALGEMAVEEKK
jgi:mannitol/fructose-specific phosphotransferase system IIA component (Ntr-type)